MTPLRKSLFFPPNAVPDTGINMRNGLPVKQSNVIPFKPKNISRPVRPKYRGPDTFCRMLCNSMPYPIEAELSERPVVLVPQVIRIVAEVFGVTEEELHSDSRCFPLTLYRQMAMALAAKLCRNNSLPNIGRYFRRDHTTVLHAKRKMQPHIDAVAAELPADAPAIEWARAMKRRIDS